MITHKTRMNRLQRLDDVLQLHRESKGKVTKLNGSCRDFNMDEWDCKTSACAFGSYALTPYGKRYFYMEYREKPACLWSVDGEKEYEGVVKLRGKDHLDSPDAAHFHFGISPEEVEWLFLPSEYNDDRKISAYTVQRRVRSIMKRYEQGKGDMQ